MRSEGGALGRRRAVVQAHLPISAGVWQARFHRGRRSGAPLVEAALAATGPPLSAGFVMSRRRGQDPSHRKHDGARAESRAPFTVGAALAATRPPLPTGFVTRRRRGQDPSHREPALAPTGRPPHRRRQPGRPQRKPDIPASRPGGLESRPSERTRPPGTPAGSVQPPPQAGVQICRLPH